MDQHRKRKVAAYLYDRHNTKPAKYSCLVVDPHCFTFFNHLTLLNYGAYDDSIVHGAAGRASCSTTSRAARWTMARITARLAATRGSGESILQVERFSTNRIHCHGLSGTSFGLIFEIAVLIGRRALSCVGRAEPRALCRALGRRSGCEGAASDASRQGIHK